VETGSPFIQRITKQAPPQAEESEAEEDRPIMRSEPKPDRVIEEIGDDEEDWSAVPAFLRRKK
jgi:hypothetical protein